MAALDPLAAGLAMADRDVELRDVRPDRGQLGLVLGADALELECPLQSGHCPGSGTSNAVFEQP